MSDYLFLKDPRRCPNCGFKGREKRSGFCGSCGTRLFAHLEYNFRTFAAEVSENFWAFCPVRGWVHRDHLLRECAKPQTRNLNLPKLPKDYGRKITPDQVATAGGKITKPMRQEMIQRRD